VKIFVVGTSVCYSRDKHITFESNSAEILKLVIAIS